MLKNILLATTLILGKFSFAQCDKTITLKCNKIVEIRDGIPGVEIPFEMALVIGGGKVMITATQNGKSETVQGPITQVVYCNWKELLKNGSAQYKATMKKEGDVPEDGLIAIKSENNYTEVTLSSDPEKESKLRLIVSEYTIEDAPVSTGKEENKPAPAKQEKKSGQSKQN
ncbi:MAG: hypothetical protein ACO1NW_00835 [Chitinophagaceae bacterium]